VRAAHYRNACLTNVKIITFAKENVLPDIFLCVFICLLAVLHKNCRSGLHENFVFGQSPLNFGCYSVLDLGLFEGNLTKCCWNGESHHILLIIQEVVDRFL